MATYIKAGDTIEGDKVDIDVRKWTPSIIVENPSVKKRMYRYSTDKNSKARILKTHIVDNDPEIIEATKDYHREVGDELSCDSMKIYVDSLRKITPKVEEGATGRHGANFVTTDKHTIATISTPLANLQKAIAAKDEQKLLESKNK